MLDWFDPKNLAYFLQWDGEIKYIQVQKIKIKRNEVGILSIKMFNLN